MSFKQSVNPTAMQGLVNGLLSALEAIPTAALLAGAKLHLFNNNIQISRHTALTDLIEPTWAGYAALLLPALSGPIKLNDATFGVTAEAVFTATAAPTPADSVYGYFVTTGATPVLAIAERFDAPVTIAEVDDFVSVQFIFPEQFLRAVGST
jgi:hypothetical protein